MPHLLDSPTRTLVGFSPSPSCSSPSPVVSRFGVHLIQVLERREATLSEREQRDMARNLVREKKLDEAFNLWAQEVRGRAYVEIRQPPAQ